MNFNSAEIGSIIKDEILGFVASPYIDESGRVYQIGDGIARVIGLKQAMSGELLQFENGVVGIAMNLAKMPIPTGVHKSITDLGRIATPLALVSLGAGFQFKRIKGYARQLIICISGKLVIGPMIMLTLAALLGFREEMLVPVLALFGSPVATSSYTMAELMDGDGVLAGSLVVLTTALSILTMFLFIFALNQLGLV